MLHNVARGNITWRLPNLLINWRQVQCRCGASARRIYHHSTVGAAQDELPLPGPTRNRLSSLWTPSQGRHSASDAGDPLLPLVKAGFLRQAYSGVYHYLPLGLRVQERLERLIDKHMSSLGASKVSLSSLSSTSLWRKSGRLQAYGQELYHLGPREYAKFVLSPTHEEEMTTLVANSLHSYRDLPLRLYQISRKYRNERRPRGGLLRSREFVMKDLYTFDLTQEAAYATYEHVQTAYRRIFDELGIPYLVAEADSGNIGGDLSHEYHLLSAAGEDCIISCEQCSYVSNEEKAVKRHLPSMQDSRLLSEFKVSTALAADGQSLVNVFYPKFDEQNMETDNMETELNAHAVRKILPSLDKSIEYPIPHWKMKFNEATSHGQTSFKIMNVFDQSCVHLVPHVKGLRKDDLTPNNLREVFQLGRSVEDVVMDPISGQSLDLTRIRTGDPCCNCQGGTLRRDHGIELGHTFFLGTRYSSAFGLLVDSPLLGHSKSSIAQKSTNAVHMGCHGIGVSRVIGAIANHMSDDRGLNWPTAIAPYDVAIIPSKNLAHEGEIVYDLLASTVKVEGNGPNQKFLEPVLDDRAADFGWKMHDADMAGYPVLVVLGRLWASKRACEVQCRRLGNLREEVAIADLPQFVKNLLARL